MIVTHEDPAAAMNPTNEQWNAIVQQNLKNFEEEKQRVIQEKKEKLKKIQDEQKRQMTIKQESDKKKVNDEIEQFKKVGMTATAPFYVNEDKRKERERELRGSG